MTLPGPIIPVATHTVTGHDGVCLTVPEFGNPDGSALLLIHGWSQSHLSWTNQLRGPLADEFRIIAPDLRGHGQSDKPADPAAYNCSAPWADDVAAIMAQLELVKPVLVGWSMGGKVIMDYLRERGDAALGGAAYVATSATSGRYQPESAAAQRSGDPAVAALAMYETDLDANLRATAAFLSACTHDPLPADVAAWMLGFNMLCPPHVRAACRLRHEDQREVLTATTCPSLIVTGGRDRIMPPALAEEMQASLPGARSVTYDNSGHAPFWEEADRFNTDLAEFTREATGA